MSDTNVPTPEPTPAYQPAYQPAPEPKKRPLPAGWIIAGVLLLAVVAISANASGDHEDTQPSGSTGTSGTSVEDDEQALAESAWATIGAESRESICVIYRIDPDTSEAMMRNADGFQVNEIDNLMTILARDC